MKTQMKLWRRIRFDFNVKSKTEKRKKTPKNQTNKKQYKKKKKKNICMLIRGKSALFDDINTHTYTMAVLNFLIDLRA